MPRTGYTVKVIDDQQIWFEIETYDTLARARAEAINCYYVHGWHHAIVKHNGKTVYDTDKDPEIM